MKNYTSIKELKVGIQLEEEVLPVGRLATREYKTYFEYDPSFIERGLEISPLKLPLETGLQVFEPSLFEGLPGVFNDSLPDGWGRLLFDRYVRSQNLLPENFSTLDRLVHMGKNAMGALVYEPDYSDGEIKEEKVNLENQAPGVYMVIFYIQANRFVSKLIISE